MVCALTIVPMLASRLLSIRVSSGMSRFWLLRSFSQRMEGVTILYGRFLSRVLQYRILIIALAFLLLGGSSFWMLQRIPQEILSRIRTGQASLSVQFPDGTNLETNRQVMREVDEVFQQQPETESVFSTSGGHYSAQQQTKTYFARAVPLT